MSVSRNGPCPCGSGKKYKRCCGSGERSATVAVTSGADVVQQYQQALQFYQQGDWQTAARICSQMLEQVKDYPPLLELGGILALQQGNLGEAEKLFGSQVKLEPENSYAHNNLCMALHELGRDGEAHEHCTRALELEPGLAEPHNNLGNIYKSQNQLEEALKHYNQAIKLGSADPRVYVNAGLTSQLLGDLDTAAQRYNEVLQHYTDFPPALNNLGVLQLKQNRLDDAERTLRQVLALVPDDVEALNNLGTVLQEKGDLPQARECFEQVLKLSPEYVGAMVNLGLLEDELGAADRAVACFERALKIAPDSADAHYNLAAKLLVQGWHEKAIGHFESALKINPYFASAKAGLGEAVLLQGRIAPARHLIEQAMQLAPYDAQVHRAMAKLLEEEGDHDEAEASWRKVIELKPALVDGYCGLASLYESQEKYDDARKVYQEGERHVSDRVTLYNQWSSLEELTHNLEQAVALAEQASEVDPTFPGLAILRAKLLRRRKEYSDAVDVLESLNAEEIKTNDLKSLYYFELGSNLDKLQQYDEAFAAYRSANDYKNLYLGQLYNAEEDKRWQEKLRSVFSAENWQRLRAAVPLRKKDDISPVFIVGFPRSGTSLLEQILGSHPQIAPAGELRFIPDLTGGKAAEIIGSSRTWPECLLDESNPVTAESLERMRDYYLDSVKALQIGNSETVWVSDKMPHNALNLGLISLLFPESPIIHISRHPFNSCLSAYFANFSSKHRYTSSLEATAIHYRNMMETLEYYEKTLDMKFLRVHYEDLVEEQEKITRQVLEFIGAPWDERCLQHHKSERVVRTASYEQVTQKIYRSSLYRYRNYWKHVEPLIPILESTIARFGYELE